MRRPTGEDILKAIIILDAAVLLLLCALFLSACRAKRQAVATASASVLTEAAASIRTHTATTDTAASERRRAFSLDSLTAEFGADSIRVQTPSGAVAVIYAPRGRRSASGVQSLTREAESRQSATQSRTEASAAASSDTRCQSASETKSEASAAAPADLWAWLAVAALAAGACLYFARKIKDRNEQRR